MERLLGICALAVSMSVFAQQGPPHDQLGEADAQERRQTTSYEQDASTQPSSPDSAQTQSGHDQQPADDESKHWGQTGQTSDIDADSQSHALQDLRSEHENLSTFVDALEETGLADSVAQGEYTAFAPTNEAFEAADIKLESLEEPGNREQLVALLRNHLVADEVDADRAKNLEQALTVGGATLELAESNGELTVNGARVTATNIRSGGLIVHTIDQVLEPTTEAMTPETQSSMTSQDQISIPSEEQDASASESQGGVPQVARTTADSQDERRDDN